MMSVYCVLRVFYWRQTKLSEAKVPLAPFCNCTHSIINVINCIYSMLLYPNGQLYIDDMHIK